MIGIVVTGHNHFATGVSSTVEMVAGQQPQYKAVDFTEDMSPELLNERLIEAIKETDSGNGVLIFTDLKGGTPFNQSVMASVQYENVKVLTGTNIAMLLEGSLARLASEDVNALADQLVETGISQVYKFSMEDMTSNEEEDGI